MTGKFYICEHLHKQQVVHGTIGNVDIEKVLLANGYQAIQFPYIFSFSVKAKLARLRYLIKTFLSIPAGATVVFQFPLYARIHQLLIKLLRWKKVRIVCVIADIEGLRNLDDRLLQKEKQELKKFRWIIVHNERMAQWMRSVVPDAQLAELEFFDFLAEPMQVNRSKTDQVVYAGNLEKSPFVKDLGRLQAPINLYGPGYQQMAAPNVQYKGVFESNTIIKELDGSFGLIWDGESIENCSGKYGEYLSYNSPHKLSLYILAGLPIIAPNTSASGSLVKKYGIGITIDSLHDLKTAIHSISEADYRQMITNMKSLAERISSGQCLVHALAALRL